jgi:hypothetical protein
MYIYVNTIIIRIPSHGNAVMWIKPGFAMDSCGAAG